MIKLRPYYIFLNLLLLIASSCAYGQQTRSQNRMGIPAQSVDFYFNTAIGPESKYFNGREYLGYHPSIEGSPYFNDVKTFETGQVIYDGFVYAGVPLMYDLTRDQLISVLYNKFTQFILVSQKVSEFEIMDHHFVRIDLDSTSSRVISKPGFYDQLYKGKIQVLAKRKKSIQEQSDSQSIKKYFSYTKAYFVFKDGQYYNVSSESSFLKLFQDKKKELQKYLKENNLKFRKDPEKAMALLAGYYDQLNTSA